MNKKVEVKQLSDEEAYQNYLQLLTDSLAKNPALPLSRHVFHALHQSYHIVKKETDGTIQILYYDTTVGYYVDAYLPFSKLLRDAYDLSKSGLLTESRLLAFYRAIFYARMYLEQLDTYNPPPSHYVPLLDGVVDVKTGELVPETECANYHFTYVRPFRFHITPSPLHITIFKRILNDWADGDEEIAQLLADYLRSAAEGNNKGKILLLEGPGGNGKSSYMTLAELIVGKESTVRLVCHQFDNDYNLDVIKDHTTLIIGNENKTNPRLRGESLAKLKSFTTNQPLTINPKYKAPRIIDNNLCCIQSSNTPFLFSESTNALRTRFVYLKWTKKDYRALKETQSFEFDLDNLLENHQFVEDVFHYLITQIPYSEKLNVPKSVKDNLVEQLEVSDNITSFVKDLKERGILQHNAILPTIYLYQAYLYWLKEENPSAKPMSKKSFVRKISQLLFAEGFVLARNDKGNLTKTRLHTIPYSKWNRYQCATTVDEDLVHSSKTTPSTYFYNENQEIPITDILDTRNWLEEHPEECEWSIEELRKVIAYTLDLQNMDSLSKYRSYFESYYK